MFNTHRGNIVHHRPRDLPAPVRDQWHIRSRNATGHRSNCNCSNAVHSSRPTYTRTPMTSRMTSVRSTCVRIPRPRRPREPQGRSHTRLRRNAAGTLRYRADVSSHRCNGRAPRAIQGWTYELRPALRDSPPPPEAASRAPAAQWGLHLPVSTPADRRWRGLNTATVGVVGAPETEAALIVYPDKTKSEEPHFAEHVDWATQAAGMGIATGAGASGPGTVGCG